MAWPPGKHIEDVIAQAHQALAEVRVVRQDISLHRALIDLEGERNDHRVIVSEIHRADGRMRYAYYVLNQDNRLIHGFDNSPDTLAIKKKYGRDWKTHRYEEIPHQHDANGGLSLTTQPMTFDTFVAWLDQHLPEINP